MEALDQAWISLAEAPDEDLDLYLYVLLAFGLAAGLAGEHERAGACIREILAIVEPRGERGHRSLALWAGGLIAWRQGDLRQAIAQELASLRIKRTLEPDRYGVSLCLEVLAWIAADPQQRHQRAATLVGAADSLQTDIGASITSYGHLVGFHDVCERQIHDALGEAPFTEAFHHGQDLTYEDAIA